MADNDLGVENISQDSPDHDDVEAGFQPEQAPSTASSNVLLQLKSLFADRGLMSNVYDKPVAALTQANGNILKAPSTLQQSVVPFDENATVSNPGDFVKQTEKPDNRSDDSIIAEIITILESNRILADFESTRVEKDQVATEVTKSSKRDEQFEVDPLDEDILKKQKPSSSGGGLHPAEPTKCAHISDLEKLSTDIKKACENGIGKQTTYSGVYVLLMSWGDADDLGVGSELDLVEEVFKERYDFNVERFVIPDKKQCWNYTSRAINNFQIDHSDPDSLYIIYYGGHGRVGDDQCCYFGPNRKSARELNWNTIQSGLEEAEQDTLILLDCCSAGAAVTRRGKLTSTTEILGAGAREVPAQVVSISSFTQRLLYELWYTKETVLYVDKIAEKLIREPQTSTDYETQPFRFLINTDSPSIGLRVANPTAAPKDPRKLRPRKATLPKAHDHHLGVPTSASVDGSRSSIEGWNSTTDPTEITPSESSEAAPHGHKVLVSAHISENVTAEKIASQKLEWINWLKRAPNGVKDLLDIKFEADFTTGSSLLFLTIPVRLWLHLRDDPAYNFVGFVRSSNHLLDTSEPKPAENIPSTVHAQYSSIKRDLAELKNFHLDAKKRHSQHFSEMRVTLERLTQHLNEISEKVKRTDSGKWLTEEEKKAGMKWIPFQKDKEKQKNQTALRNSLSEIEKEIQQVKGILVEFKVKFDMENAPEVAEENSHAHSTSMQEKNLVSRPVLASAITVA